MDTDDTKETLQSKRPTILIVDDVKDDRDLFGIWFEKVCKPPFLAKNSTAALKILRERKEQGFKVDIALIDVGLGPESGVELSNTIKKQYPSMLVLLMTGAIMDNYGYLHTDIQCVVKAGEENKLVPLVMNFWRTEHLRKDLGKKLSLILEQFPHKDRIKGVIRTPYEDFEALDGIIQRADGIERYIRWVIYRYSEHPGMVDFGLTVGRGCPGRCEPCQTGKITENVTSLTPPEMVAQFLHLLDSFQAFGFLEEGYEFSLNYTCGNDFIFNAENVIRSIEMLAEIRELPISFIITTIGNTAVFRKYLPMLSKYLVKIYLSGHSLDPEKRNWFLPMTEGQSLFEQREILAELHQTTGKRSTYCHLLTKGFNDSSEDIRQIAEFCQGWPFDVKVMPIADGCSQKYPEVVTPEDVRIFVDKLQDRGVDARARFVVGPKNATCGTTIPYEEIRKKSVAMGNVRRHVRRTRP